MDAWPSAARAAASLAASLALWLVLAGSPPLAAQSAPSSHSPVHR